MFLVTAPSELKGFVRESDRQFFSVPVEVEMISTDINTKLITVRSPLQGGITYPVVSSSLKPAFRLTNRQRAAARRIG